MQVLYLLDDLFSVLLKEWFIVPFRRLLLEVVSVVPKLRFFVVALEEDFKLFDFFTLSL